MAELPRDDMHPEAGIAYDAEGARYDITAWRKAIAVVVGAVSSTLTAMLAILNKLSFDSNDQLRVAPIIADEYGETGLMLGDNIFQGALVAISPEHHEIHCGDSYECSYIEDLGNGATRDILIVVPDEEGEGQTQKLYHLLGMVSVEAETTIRFYEGPTFSAAGTAIDVFNRNRNSSNADLLAVTYGPTITGTGTQLQVDKLGSGKSIGGTASRQEEWLLKNNTAYLLRVTNDTTSNNFIDVKLNYYVHPGI